MLKFLKEQYPITAHAPNFDFWTGCREIKRCEEHEEPQAVIFLHGVWRHIKEFGIEGQIPRISLPVKLEERC